MARKHHHSDPLDLLLDTMTNAFGAIIMIAISVSLFVNETKKATDPSATSKTQMTQRKAARIAEEMAAAKTLEAQLERKLSQSSDVARMIQQREALQEKIRVLEAELKNEPAVETPNVEMTGSKLTELSREVMNLKDRAAKLTEQSQSMGKQALNTRARQTIDLTPPAPVRETNKAPYSVVFRHNQFFPLMAPNPAGGMMRNDKTVRWVDVGSIAEVEPVAGAGLDVLKNEAAVREVIALLRKLKGAAGENLYVACYVYKDSFEAYLRFKQLFLQAKTGIAQGWEPVNSEENLKFGATGFKPGEQ